MTAAGFKYLKAVSELGACGVKITEISEKTGLSKVSVYRAVSRLEAAGYTERDERNRITITPIGKEQLDNYIGLISWLEVHFATHCGVDSITAREDAIAAVCAVSDGCRNAIFELFKKGCGK